MRICCASNLSERFSMIGKTIGHERYKITELLGEGGMASVYKADDSSLGRPVAVKFIRRDRVRSKKMVERFKQEARALSQVRHPNILNVHDFGEHDGNLYLVTEYVAGGTLREKLDKPTGWQAAVKQVLALARAVEHAHAQGILHRDIKPSNVLIRLNDEVVLSDFGIAVLLDQRGSKKEQDVTSTVGTPEYMAPEQATRGRKVDHRVDIYALGVLFYEMLNGSKPYSADTPVAVLLKHVNEPVPAPSEVVPDVPAAVEQVVKKAMAKDPDDRYVTAAAFADALQQLVGGAPETLSLQQRLTELVKAPRVAWPYWAGGLIVVGAIGFTMWRLAVRPPSVPEIPTEIAGEALEQIATEIPAQPVPATNPLVVAMATQLAVLQKVVENLGSAQLVESGTVVLEEAVEPEAEPVALEELDLGDALNVDGFIQAGRSLKLTLANGTEISLGENTVFRFGESGADPSASEMKLTLSDGEMWINLHGGKLAVKTPAGIATVEGSMLGISYSSEDESIDTTCMEGTVKLFTRGDEGTIVPPGQRAESSVGTDAPAVASAMPTEKLVGWAMNVSDSIEVMADAEVVPQDTFVDMAASLPTDDQRGQEALGTVVEVADVVTLVSVVENVPAESLGIAMAVVDERDPQSVKFDAIMDMIPDETLGEVVAGVSARSASEQALVRFVDDLSDERLENMTIGAPPEALSAVIVAMDAFDPESEKFGQIVQFVPDEALGELVEGAAGRDDNKRAMARFVNNLSDERLETMALDATEEALGEMIVSMSAFGFENHVVSDVLAFVPPDKMMGMLEAVATISETEGEAGSPGLSFPIPAPGQEIDPMAAVNQAISEMWTFMPEDLQSSAMDELKPEHLGVVAGGLAFDDAAGGGALLGGFMGMMPEDKLGGTLDAIADAGGEMEDVAGYLDSDDLANYFEYTQAEPGGGGALGSIKEFVPGEIVDGAIDIMPDFDSLDDLEQEIVLPPEKPAEEFFETPGGDEFFEQGERPEEPRFEPGEGQIMPRPEEPKPDPGEGQMPPGFEEPKPGPDEGQIMPRPEEPRPGPGEGQMPPGFEEQRPGPGIIPKPEEELPAPQPEPEEPIFAPVPEPEEPLNLPPPEEIATELPGFQDDFQEEFPATPVP